MRGNDLRGFGCSTRVGEVHCQQQLVPRVVVAVRPLRRRAAECVRSRAADHLRPTPRAYERIFDEMGADAYAHGQAEISRWDDSAVNWVECPQPVVVGAGVAEAPQPPIISPALLRPQPASEGVGTLGVYEHAKVMLEAPLFAIPLWVLAPRLLDQALPRLFTLPTWSRPRRRAPG